MLADSDSSLQVPVALCLGGMDPSAGAGLLRDVLTLASLGVHPMAVSTAETIQNGISCQLIAAPSLNPARRLDSLRPHLSGRWGVKLGLCAIGMEELEGLMAGVDEMAPLCRIWDPIQAPTSGVSLHDGAALRRMAAVVLRGGEWVVSPNRMEAATFGGLSPDGDPLRLAQAFLETGARAVWIKGGHASGESLEDFWVDARGARGLGRRPRLPGDRRGTGCALASAWLGFRLGGLEDLDASRRASGWIQEHWAGAFTPGGAGRPVFAPERA
jgi:hydroxymethylpyrimidine/phosphomethylpyrimidine kinase